MSNLATDYIQKRRGEPFDIKVKVTTWIGHKVFKIGHAIYMDTMQQ